MADVVVVKLDLSPVKTPAVISMIPSIISFVSWIMAVSAAYKTPTGT